MVANRRLCMAARAAECLGAVRDLLRPELGEPLLTHTEYIPCAYTMPCLHRWRNVPCLTLTLTLTLPLALTQVTLFLVDEADMPLGRASLYTSLIFLRNSMVKGLGLGLGLGPGLGLGLGSGLRCRIFLIFLRDSMVRVPQPSWALGWALGPSSAPASGCASRLRAARCTLGQLGASSRLRPSHCVPSHCVASQHLGRPASEFADSTASDGR